MHELSLDYRVATGRAAAGLSEVRRFQRVLRERHASLQARLSGRPDEADGLQTWMEIYACPASPDGVLQALRDDIEAAAARLAPLIDGHRHCEVFEPL